MPVPRTYGVFTADSGFATGTCFFDTGFGAGALVAFFFTAERRAPDSPAETDASDRFTAGFFTATFSAAAFSAAAFSAAAFSAAAFSAAAFSA
ncbi:MAG: hypothetical protein WBM63_16635, partial [Sedimenticolaceae bacterium]